MICTIWRHMKLLWNSRFPIVPTQSSLFKFIAFHTSSSPLGTAWHVRCDWENRAPKMLDSHGFPWFPNEIGHFFLVPRLHLSFFDNPSSLKNFTLSGFRSSCSSQCRKKAASSWSASCWTAVGEMGKWLVSPRTRLQLWPSYHHYHHCHRYNVTTTTTSSIINKTIIYI